MDKFTKKELKALEEYADTLFASYDIDVKLTRHFFERLNDDRNGKQITLQEMRRLFRSAFAKHGKRIEALDPGANRVIKSMSSDINMPFVIVWDDKNYEFDLVVKTVMRKKNFKSSSKILKVESVVREIIREEMQRLDERLHFEEKPSLASLGITNFKSLFKLLPTELQKRVYALKDIDQRRDYHPEGNTLKHTIMVVKRAIQDDDIDLVLAALFHDIGKDETGKPHPKKGYMTHWGHERVSGTLVKKYAKFIKSLGGNAANILYIVKYHMKAKKVGEMRPAKQAKLKSFRAWDSLERFTKHDRGGLDM
jgi:hypothetical protein